MASHQTVHPSIASLVLLSQQARHRKRNKDEQSKSYEVITIDVFYVFYTNCIYIIIVHDDLAFVGDSKCVRHANDQTGRFQQAWTVYEDMLNSNVSVGFLFRRLSLVSEVFEA